MRAILQKRQPGRDDVPNANPRLPPASSWIQYGLSYCPDRFREQPAQLLDRLRLDVVLGQIFIHEPSERERARRAVRARAPVRAPPPHPAQTQNRRAGRREKAARRAEAAQLDQLTIRQRLAHELNERKARIPYILDALLTKAEKGDVPAARELRGWFDQGLGRPEAASLTQAM